MVKIMINVAENYNKIVIVIKNKIIKNQDLILNL
jgi:hypothetical protein